MADNNYFYIYVHVQLNQNIFSSLYLGGVHPRHGFRCSCSPLLLNLRVLLSSPGVVVTEGIFLRGVYTAGRSWRSISATPYAIRVGHLQ